MKPTKNRIFCIGCMHHKMLFESQSKADNFIKFNSDEIAEQSGKAPSRSYYCSFCCGWHITSIADTDEAVARDERDARVWEQIKNVTVTKTKKKQARAIEENQAPQKSKKFPRSEQGIKLRVIAENVDRTIRHIESALFNADVHALRSQFDRLIDFEQELRSKSAEFGIDIIAIDKRYENIASIKELFSKVFDFLADPDKRQSYLASVPEDEKSKRENIIINNTEIIYRIKTSFEHINRLSDVDNQDEIRELCNDIRHNLIPQLKGSTSKLKQYFKYNVEQILSDLESNKRGLEGYYKQLILTIIGYMEDAYKAYSIKDYEQCETSLKQAEILLPDPTNEVETALFNQMINLRNLLP